MEINRRRMGEFFKRILFALAKLKFIRDAYHFFRMARPVNILLALLVYMLSAYISALRETYFFTDPLFIQQGLIMSGAMIGGYWINDVYDYKIDRINRPDNVRVGSKISAKKIYTGYLFLTLGIVVFTVLLPLKFIIINYCAILILYFYASYFKRATVLGNLMIALLSASVVLCGALLYHIKWAHLWAIIFAFIISFIREVTKDVEDVKGDLHYRLRTLPILLGLRATRYILLVSHGLLLCAVNLPALFFYLQGNEADAIKYWYFSFMFTQAPILINVQLLKKSIQPQDYSRQSQLLKIIMISGLITIMHL